MPITSTNQQAILSLVSVTPGNSAIGDVAAAGTSGSVARADHVHGREAAGTAGASAVGDTAAAGSATTVARSDHRHSREAFGTPATVTGGATAASGSATTVARSDHAHSTTGLPVLLSRQTLSSGTTTITFSSIPSTYTDLRIAASCRNSRSALNQSAIFRVNSLSTSIYDDGYNSSTGTSIAIPVQATSTYRTDAMSALGYYIYNYSSTSTTRKVVVTYYGWNNSTSAVAMIFGQHSHTISVGAISSITIAVADTANDTWVAGSSFCLYGIP